MYYYYSVHSVIRSIRTPELWIRLSIYPALPPGPHPAWTPSKANPRPDKPEESR